MFQKTTTTDLDRAWGDIAVRVLRAMLIIDGLFACGKFCWGIVRTYLAGNYVGSVIHLVCQHKTEELCGQGTCAGTFRMLA